MAYEYEHRLRNYLIGHKNVNPKFDGFEILKSLGELQEVYRKAKAFDEILNLPDTYGYAEDYAEDVDIIISEYKERMNDER